MRACGPVSKTAEPRGSLVNMVQLIQAAAIEHRETRDGTGVCVGCSCGQTWPADDALLAYGQHLAVVLVDSLALDLLVPVPESVMWEAAAESFLAGLRRDTP